MPPSFEALEHRPRSSPAESPRTTALQPEGQGQEAALREGAAAEQRQSRILSILEEIYERRMAERQGVKRETGEQIGTLYHELANRVRGREVRFLTHVADRVQDMAQKIYAIEPDTDRKQTLADVHTQSSEAKADAGIVVETVKNGVDAGQAATIFMAGSTAGAALLGGPGAIIASSLVGAGSYAVMRKIDEWRHHIPGVKSLSETWWKLLSRGTIAAGLGAVVIGAGLTSAVAPIALTIAGISAISSFFRRREEESAALQNDRRPAPVTPAQSAREPSAEERGPEYRMAA